MPFQSPKQRRYMHANLPEIANRWERDYANGGRIGFDSGSENKGVKISPILSMSKTSETPVEGIDVDVSETDYGIAGMYQGDNLYGGGEYTKGKVKVNVQEDGNTVFEDSMSKDDLMQLYLGIGQKEGNHAELGTDGQGNWTLNIIKSFNQGGLIPSHEAGIYGLAEGGVPDIGFSKVKPSNDGSRPGYFTAEYGGGDTSTSDSGSSGGGDAGHLSHNVSVSLGGTKPDTKTSTGDGYQDRIIELADRKRKSDLRNIITRGDEEKYDNPLDKYSYTPQGTINRQKFKEKQALDNWNAVKDSNKTWAKKKAGKVLVDQLLLGGATFGLSDVIGGIVQGFKTNKAKNEFINTIKGSIAEYQKLGFAEHSPHKDTLIQDLNQQLLDLTQTRDTPDQGPDGGDGITGVASITYDDIEDKNKKERASMRWVQEQDKVDRSKQMAYWRMMMQPYMSAKGGRVPAGYNTGGLSNLFRLKNR